MANAEWEHADTGINSRMRRMFALILTLLFLLLFLRMIAPFFEALVLAAAKKKPPAVSRRGFLALARMSR